MYTDDYKVYKEAVVRDYLAKKEVAREGWLINPTRHKIKTYCRQLAESGISAKDMYTLCRYLNITPGDPEYLSLLRKTMADDFRGFELFLRNPEIKASEESIELLAWLIDFPLRPFAVFNKDGYAEPQFVAADKLKKDVPEKNKYEGREGQKASKPKLPWSWIVGAAAVLCLILYVALMARKEPGCMYWSGDHYVATDCDVPRLDTPLIALDRARLNGFKRLKNVDTLTTYAVDRFWYARSADSMEVYTGGGNHPLYANKPLKKVTDYVVNVCHNRRHTPDYGKP